MSHLWFEDAAGRSDPGPCRGRNDDRYLATPSQLAVADGMGGAPAGDVAAQLAVDVLADHAPTSAPELVAAFEEAHRVISLRGRERGCEGMGCTLVAIVAGAAGDLVVANVGDARAYLWRGGPLVGLTRDHNEAQSLVDAGALSPAEARTHPSAARLTRAVGPRQLPAVDVSSVVGVGDDRLLVCSDGLTAELAESEIVEILTAEPDNDAAADRLVAGACGRGARDNVTAVVATGSPKPRRHPVRSDRRRPGGHRA